MVEKKILLLFIGILGATVADEDNGIKIPFIGPVIGAVEGAVNSAADVVIDGEQLITSLTVGDTIRKALNRFKALMVDKIELLGLPRLEPLELKEPIDINITHEIGRFNGTLDNLQILHLSTFDTRDIAIHGIVPFDVDLNLYFDDLEIYGNYDIDAVVSDLFHVFGKGPFHIILHKVNTFVTIKKIRLKAFKHIQFEDISINVTLGSLTSNLTNLMGGGDSEKLFNKVIEDIAPGAVDTLWPEIEPIITTKMKEVGNKKLSEVTLKEFMKLLVPSADGKP